MNRSFRVYASEVVYYYLDLEADNKGDAEDKAMNLTDTFSKNDGWHEYGSEASVVRVEEWGA